MHSDAASWNIMKHHEARHQVWFCRQNWGHVESAWVPEDLPISRKVSEAVPVHKLELVKDGWHPSRVHTSAFWAASLLHVLFSYFSWTFLNICGSNCRQFIWRRTTSFHVRRLFGRNLSVLICHSPNSKCDFEGLKSSLQLCLICWTPRCSGCATALFPVMEKTCWQQLGCLHDLPWNYNDIQWQ